MYEEFLAGGRYGGGGWRRDQKHGNVEKHVPIEDNDASVSNVIEASNDVARKMTYAEIAMIGATNDNKDNNMSKTKNDDKAHSL